ncbi:MAG TPA: peptide ABC transporter substrate-binding protein [Candidatus Dormibacteraeota bacterium]|nr:peptide ABC transporter substrate-binding protein [Candidatus Dormibacteraeota bacterium]
MRRKEGADDDRPGWRCSRRRFLQGLGAAACSLALTASPAACDRRPATPSAGRPRAGGQLVEGGLADVSHLLPVLAQDPPSLLVSRMLFEGLLGVAADGSPFPLLAESLPRLSADGTTYTFRLRRGLRWSDGHPLTGDDVVFTYQLMFAPRYEDLRSPWRTDLLLHLEEVTSPDPLTVIFRTRGVYAPFLALHAQHGIVPEHVLGSLSGAAIESSDFDRAPAVVNGAFRFVGWDPGREMVLARNDAYHGPRARLERYVYQVLPDAAALAEALVSGQIDLAGQIDPALWQELADRPGVRRIPPFPVPTVTFYTTNLDPSTRAGKLFSDVAVRQALLLALDRHRLAATVYRGLAAPADSVEPPCSWAHVAAEPAYPHDPERAGHLLEEAGWSRGPDGIRQREGLRLDLTVTTDQEDPERRALAAAMSQDWRRIGVGTTLQVVPFAQLVAQLSRERTFDVLLAGLTWPQDPDQSPLFSSAATVPGGLNGFGLRDGEVDWLLAEAVQTTDPRRRRRLYVLYQDRMNQLLPAPTLLFHRGLWAARERVRGLALGPYSQYEGRSWMRGVWVADGR